MQASDFFVRKLPPQKKSCFVLMPFEGALDPVYEHGIKPMVESLGMQCRRADEMYSAQGILSDIWSSIQIAELVIADLTGKNPNVMYELGLCHALWKRVILLSQNRDDVPFDLRQWRVIWYDFTFAGAARLKDELQRAIEAIRAEEATESELVPLKRVTEKLKEPQLPIAFGGPAAGSLRSWGTGNKFGFIAGDDGYDYYTLQKYMISNYLPRVGDRVFFIKQAPEIEGKSPIATAVLLLGDRVEGEITDVKYERGFLFVRCYDDVRYQHDVFWHTGDLTKDLRSGNRVSFVVGQQIDRRTNQMRASVTEPVFGDRGSEPLKDETTGGGQIQDSNEESK